MSLFQSFKKIVKFKTISFNSPLSKSNESRFHPALRVISLFVACIFSWDTIVWSAPPLSISQNPDLKKQVLLKFLKDLSIPESLGNIEARFVPENFQLRGAAPFIIHIQDAHAHPEAQRSIEALLEYLVQRAKIKTIALEAAFGKIDPRILNLFSLPEANRALVDHLASLGELTGAELFALKQKGTPLELYGVEDQVLYRKSYLVFQKIKSLKNKTEEHLVIYKKALEEFENNILSKGLREFIRKKKVWQENPPHSAAGPSEVATDPPATQWRGSVAESDESLDYFRVLKGLSKTHLQLDLTDPRNQFQWPNLTRLMKADEKETNLKREAAFLETGNLADQLAKGLPQGRKRDFLVSGLRFLARPNPERSFEEWLIVNTSYPEIRSVRRFFEDLHRAMSEKDLSLLHYPNLLTLGGLLILREEIDAAALFKEVKILEEQIEQRLAKTKKEKRLLELASDLLLLEKLLALNMTREDYEAYRKRKSFLAPSQMKARFLHFSKQGREWPLFSEKLLKSAERFYQLSRRRDRALFENTLRLTETKRTKDDQAIRPMVLIAGGFHTQGLAALLKSQKIPHVVISPRMSHFEGEDLYEKVMLGENAKLDGLPARLKAGLLTEPNALAKLFLTYALQNPDRAETAGVRRSEVRKLLARATLEAVIPALRKKGMTEDQVRRAVNETLQRHWKMFGGVKIFSDSDGEYRTAIGITKNEVFDSTDPKGKELGQSVSTLRQKWQSFHNSSFSFFSSGVKSQPNTNIPISTEQRKNFPGPPIFTSRSEVRGAGTKIVNIFRNVLPSASRLLRPNSDFIGASLFAYNLYLIFKLVNNYLPSNSRSEVRENWLEKGRLLIQGILTQTRPYRKASTFSVFTLGTLFVTAGMFFYPLPELFKDPKRFGLLFTLDSFLLTFSILSGRSLWLEFRKKESKEVSTTLADRDGQPRSRSETRSAVISGTLIPLLKRLREIQDRYYRLEAESRKKRQSPDEFAEDPRLMNIFDELDKVATRGARELSGYVELGNLKLSELPHLLSWFIKWIGPLSTKQRGKGKTLEEIVVTLLDTRLEVLLRKAEGYVNKEREILRDQFQYWGSKFFVRHQRRFKTYSFFYVGKRKIEFADLYSKLFSLLDEFDPMGFGIERKIVRVEVDTRGEEGEVVIPGNQLKKTNMDIERGTIFRIVVRQKSRRSEVRAGKEPEKIWKKLKVQIAQKKAVAVGEEQETFDILLQVGQTLFDDLKLRGNDVPQRDRKIYLENFLSFASFLEVLLSENSPQAIHYLLSTSETIRGFRFLVSFIQLGAPQVFHLERFPYLLQRMQTSYQALGPLHRFRVPGFDLWVQSHRKLDERSKRTILEASQLIRQSGILKDYPKLMRSLKMIHIENAAFKSLKPELFASLLIKDDVELAVKERGWEFFYHLERLQYYKNVKVPYGLVALSQRFENLERSGLSTAFLLKLQKSGRVRRDLRSKIKNRLEKAERVLGQIEDEKVVAVLSPDAKKWREKLKKLWKNNRTVFDSLRSEVRAQIQVEGARLPAVGQGKPTAEDKFLRPSTLGLRPQLRRSEVRTEIQAEGERVAGKGKQSPVRQAGVNLTGEADVFQRNLAQRRGVAEAPHHRIQDFDTGELASSVKVNRNPFGNVFGRDGGFFKPNIQGINLGIVGYPHLVNSLVKIIHVNNNNNPVLFLRKDRPYLFGPIGLAVPDLVKREISFAFQPSQFSGLPGRLKDSLRYFFFGRSPVGQLNSGVVTQNNRFVQLRHEGKLPRPAVEVNTFNDAPRSEVRKLAEGIAQSAKGEKPTTMPYALSSLHGEAARRSEVRLPLPERQAGADLSAKDLVAEDLVAGSTSSATIHGGLRSGRSAEVDGRRTERFVSKSEVRRRTLFDLKDARTKVNRGLKSLEEAQTQKARDFNYFRNIVANDRNIFGPNVLNRNLVKSDQRHMNFTVGRNDGQRSAFSDGVITEGYNRIPRKHRVSRPRIKDQINGQRGGFRTLEFNTRDNNATHFFSQLDFHRRTVRMTEYSLGSIGPAYVTYIVGRFFEDASFWKSLWRSLSWKRSFPSPFDSSVNRNASQSPWKRFFAAVSFMMGILPYSGQSLAQQLLRVNLASSSRSEMRALESNPYPVSSNQRGDQVTGDEVAAPPSESRHKEGGQVRNASENYYTALLSNRPSAFIYNPKKSKAAGREIYYTVDGLFGIEIPREGEMKLVIRPRGEAIQIYERGGDYPERFFWVEELQEVEVKEKGKKIPKYEYKEILNYKDYQAELPLITDLDYDPGEWALTVKFDSRAKLESQSINFKAEAGWWGKLGYKQVLAVVRFEPSRLERADLLLELLRGIVADSKMTGTGHHSQKILDLAQEFIPLLKTNLDKGINPDNELIERARTLVESDGLIRELEHRRFYRQITDTLTADDAIRVLKKNPHADFWIRRADSLLGNELRRFKPFDWRLKQEDAAVVDEIVVYQQSIAPNSPERQELYEFLQHHDSQLAAEALARLGINWPGVVPKLVATLRGAKEGNPRAAAAQLRELAVNKTYGGLAAPGKVTQAAKKVWTAKPQYARLLEPVPFPEFPKLTASRPGVLVLNRHGETDRSEAVQNKTAGWHDAKLTKKGRQEAFESGLLFKIEGLRFGRAFSSDLSRARDTLVEFLKAGDQPGLAIKAYFEFRERDYGDLVGWKRKDIERVFGEAVWKKWRRGYQGDDVRPPGGENLVDTQGRVIPRFVFTVLQRIAAGENVILSAHGNSLRAILVYLIEHTEGRKLTEEEVLKLEVALSTPIVVVFGSDLRHTALVVDKTKTKQDVQDFLVRHSAPRSEVRAGKGKATDKKDPRPLIRFLLQEIKQGKIKVVNRKTLEKYLNDFLREETALYNLEEIISAVLDVKRDRLRTIAALLLLAGYLPMIPILLSAFLGRYRRKAGQQIAAPREIEADGEEAEVDDVTVNVPTRFQPEFEKPPTYPQDELEDLADRVLANLEEELGEPLSVKNEKHVRAAAQYFRLTESERYGASSPAMTEDDIKNWTKKWEHNFAENRKAMILEFFWRWQVREAVRFYKGRLKQQSDLDFWSKEAKKARSISPLVNAFQPRSEVRAGKQVKGERLKGKGEKIGKEETLNVIPFRESESVVRRDEFSPRSLYRNEGFSQRGTVRPYGTDAASGSFRARQYRRRQGAVAQKGVSAVSLYGPRFPLRAYGLNQGRPEAGIFPANPGEVSVRIDQRGHSSIGRIDQESAVKFSVPLSPYTFSPPFQSRSEVRSEIFDDPFKKDPTYGAEYQHLEVLDQELVRAIGENRKKQGEFVKANPHIVDGSPEAEGLIGVVENTERLEQQLRFVLDQKAILEFLVLARSQPESADKVKKAEELLQVVQRLEGILNDLSKPQPSQDERKKWAEEIEGLNREYVRLAQLVFDLKPGEALLKQLEKKEKEREARKLDLVETRIIRGTLNPRSEVRGDDELFLGILGELSDQELALLKEMPRVLAVLIRAKPYTTGYTDRKKPEQRALLAKIQSILERQLEKDFVVHVPGETGSSYYSLYSLSRVIQEFQKEGIKEIFREHGLESEYDDIVGSKKGPDTWRKIIIDLLTQGNVPSRFRVNLPKADLINGIALGYYAPDVDYFVTQLKGENPLSTLPVKGAYRDLGWRGNPANQEESRKLLQFYEKAIQKAVLRIDEELLLRQRSPRSEVRTRTDNRQETIDHRPKDWDLKSPVSRLRSMVGVPSRSEVRNAEKVVRFSVPVALPSQEKGGPALKDYLEEILIPANPAQALNVTQFKPGSLTIQVSGNPIPLDRKEDLEGPRSRVHQGTYRLEYDQDVLGPDTERQAYYHLRIAQRIVKEKKTDDDENILLLIQRAFEEVEREDWDLASETIREAMGFIKPKKTQGPEAEEEFSEEDRRLLETLRKAKTGAQDAEQFKELSPSLQAVNDFLTQNFAAELAGESADLLALIRQERIRVKIHIEKSPTGEGNIYQFGFILRNASGEFKEDQEKRTSVFTSQENSPFYKLLYFILKASMDQLQNANGKPGIDPKNLKKMNKEPGFGPVIAKIRDARSELRRDNNIVIASRRRSNLVFPPKDGFAGSEVENQIASSQKPLLAMTLRESYDKLAAFLGPDRPYLYARWVAVHLAGGIFVPIPVELLPSVAPFLNADLPYLLGPLINVSPSPFPLPLRGGEDIGEGVSLGNDGASLTLKTKNEKVGLDITIVDKLPREEDLIYLGIAKVLQEEPHRFIRLVALESNREEADQMNKAFARQYPGFGRRFKIYALQDGRNFQNALQQIISGAHNAAQAAGSLSEFYNSVSLSSRNLQLLNSVLIPVGLLIQNNLPNTPGIQTHLMRRAFEFHEGRLLAEMIRRLEELKSRILQAEDLVAEDLKLIEQAFQQTVAAIRALYRSA